MRVLINVTIYFQSTLEKTILFMESISHTTEPLADTASILAGRIHETFNTTAYTTPLVTSNGNKYLPETIYEDDDAAMECNATLSWNITPAWLNLKELSNLNDTDEFIAKFKEFNYDKFIHDMIKYMGSFAKCTSCYSSYITAFDTHVSSAVSFAKRNISVGDAFIFETESQVFPMRMLWMKYDWWTRLVLFPKHVKLTLVFLRIYY